MNFLAETHHFAVNVRAHIHLIGKTKTDVAAQFGNIFYVLRYFGIKFLFAERFSVRTRHLRFGEVGYYGFSVLETTYRRAKVCAAGIDEDFFAAFDFIPAYVAYVRRHHGNRAEAV